MSTRLDPVKSKTNNFGIGQIKLKIITPPPPQTTRSKLDLILFWAKTNFFTSGSINSQWVSVSLHFRILPECTVLFNVIYTDTQRSMKCISVFTQSGVYASTGIDSNIRRRTRSRRMANRRKHDYVLVVRVAHNRCLLFWNGEYDLLL